jgi:hypothetical protein
MKSMIAPGCTIGTLLSGISPLAISGPGVCPLAMATSIWPALVPPVAGPEQTTANEHAPFTDPGEINMSARTPIILFLAAFLAGCANWVKLDEGAENIRLVSSGEVTRCDRIGQTTASVRERVGIYQRRPGKVEQELANLARNSALEIGGDTIVADGPVDDGRQRFSVYRCLR